MADLTNKVVVVTGASDGIGRKTALFLAKCDAAIVLVARRKEALEIVLNNLAGGPKKHLSVVADISNDTDVKRLVEEVIKKYGKVDVLINNAAISYVGRVKDMDIKKAEDVININLLGTIRVTHGILPHMIEQKSGHIINVSSILGKGPAPYRSLYCASKYGMEGFMESLRLEVAKYNINVSIIRPPSVQTNFSKKIEVDSKVKHHALTNFKVIAVAKAISGLIKRPRREVNMGIMAGGFIFLTKHFPSLFDRIVREK
ncbi:MAG: SDR family NAD(P)-dependent oxidoreductase [Candidatus Omnitrophica bacterium]|nr:SDR family NAD(P)-dependent oxidoreductase [Candidatus Omnitrophota bacterium]MBU4488212.1 SDR family NAD(P)-dependent oxidoreductase [Candidatus Omnitrophota bacterium]